jgi:hypothetical protein
MALDVAVHDLHVLCSVHAARDKAIVFRALMVGRTVRLDIAGTQDVFAQDKLFGGTGT